MTPTSWSSRRSNRLSRCSIAGAVALALVAACGGSESAHGNTSATGGTIVIDIPNDPPSAFPPLVVEEAGRLVQDQVFDRLAEIDSTLTTVGDKSFRPRLAQSWTWAPDSMSIAFHLDPKARWHDGKPVTANDVRYSYSVYVDPAVASVVAPLLANVDSVAVRDSLTPVFWFKHRTPEQFYDVAYQLVVFPQHVYGAIPDSLMPKSDATRNLVGSGQFRLAKWEAGTRIELVADTANYRGRPKLDRLILTPVGPAGAATQLLSGQADMMEAFPFDEAAKLDSSAVARPWPIWTLGYTYAAFNPHARKSTTAPHPILSDVRVRRALFEGLDRASMLKNVFGRYGLLNHGPFSARASYGDTTIRLPAYDTTAAKAALDSAGWKVGAGGVRMKNGKPLELSLMAPTSSAPRQRYAVLIQEQLRRIGVKADVEDVDPKTQLAREHAGDFDLVLHTWIPDPSVSGAKQSWATAGITGGDNFIRYSNPRVDALLDSAVASFDPAKVKSYSSRAFQVLVDDVPAVWLYDLPFYGAVNRRITVVPGRPDEWWANIAGWSIAPDKRIDRDRIGLAPPKS